MTDPTDVEITNEPVPDMTHVSDADLLEQDVIIPDDLLGHYDDNTDDEGGES